MRKFHPIVLIAMITMSAGLGVLPAAADDDAMPAVGEPAPEFSLPGTDGKTHDLGDYRGKAVVIAWFPKAFTGG